MALHDYRHDYRFVMRLALAIVGLTLASGCALPGTPRGSCTTANAPSLPYRLMSHTERTDDLPGETVVAAHRYSIRTDRASVKPCSDIAIVKEVHIRRASGHALKLREHRSFFAEDGTEVAKSSEAVGKYLTRSGTYRAVQVLPIPARTPGGEYSVVSELYLDDPDNGEILLNRARTQFWVEAPAAKPAKATPRAGTTSKTRADVNTRR